MEVDILYHRSGKIGLEDTGASTSSPSSAGVNAVQAIRASYDQAPEYIKPLASLRGDSLTWQQLRRPRKHPDPRARRQHNRLHTRRKTPGENHRRTSKINLSAFPRQPAASVLRQRRTRDLHDLPDFPLRGRAFHAPRRRPRLRRQR